MNVKDLIDYQECAIKLAEIFFPDKSTNQISRAIEHYFQSGSSWDEDVVYTKQQASEFVDRLLTEFVAEQANCTLLDAKTAIKLQMPITSNVSATHPAGVWL